MQVGDDTAHDDDDISSLVLSSQPTKFTHPREHQKLTTDPLWHRSRRLQRRAHDHRTIVRKDFFHFQQEKAPDSRANRGMWPS
ncbi:hypothetical protein ACS0TY_036045 [Phlomoides rotata]